MEPTDLAITVGSIFLAFIIFAFVLKGVWNSTMPEIFKVQEISAWQAFKLMLIASILFGGSHAYTALPDMTSPTPAVVTQ